MKNFDFTEEDKAFIYLLYGSDPSSENLVSFATLQRLDRIATSLEKLTERICEGAIETYNVE